MPEIWKINIPRAQTALRVGHGRLKMSNAKQIKYSSYLLCFENEACENT